MKQHGSTADMIHKIPELIEAISAVMKLEEGDLILTGKRFIHTIVLTMLTACILGTPAGVGLFKSGDVLTAGIGHDLAKMQFRAVEES